MPKVIVSLISDQTIPNIEFIKEMRNTADQFLFISTEGMEKKGTRQWILTTLNLHPDKVQDPVVVDAFSFEDIEAKLGEVVNDNDTYIVNLTGGTKIMSLAVHEFFLPLRSEMYYLTGGGKKIRLHPGRTKPVIPLRAKISLPEYLSAYGFEITNESSPTQTKETSARMVDYFLYEFNRTRDVPVLNLLRKHRSKPLKQVDSNEKLVAFLKRVGFELKGANKLDKYECRYLSGDWLEEYLFNFLKDHFDIPGDAIALSLHVEKGNSPNELDVIVMRKNRLYLFECKTSIYLDSEESQTFIGETIYKSDSLRSKFGLFAQTTVVTLSDLSNPKLKTHLQRADASKVKLIGRAAFVDNLLKEELEKV